MTLLADILLRTSNIPLFYLLKSGQTTNVRFQQTKNYAMQIFDFL